MLLFGLILIFGIMVRSFIMLVRTLVCFVFVISAFMQFI